MLDLPAIKARLAAATTGPWEYGTGHSLDANEGAVWEAGHEGNGERRVACWIMRPETGEFIAHSWSDIAALIAAVEAADSNLEKLALKLNVLENYNGSIGTSLIQDAFGFIEAYRQVRGEVTDGTD